MGILDNWKFGSIIKPDGSVQTPNTAQQTDTAGEAITVKRVQRVDPTLAKSFSIADLAAKTSAVPSDAPVVPADSKLSALQAVMAESHSNLAPNLSAAAPVETSALDVMEPKTISVQHETPEVTADAPAGTPNEEPVVVNPEIISPSLSPQTTVESITPVVDQPPASLPVEIKSTEINPKAKEVTSTTNEKLHGRDLMESFIDDLGKLEKAGRELQALHLQQEEKQKIVSAEVEKENVFLVDQKAIKDAMEAMFNTDISDEPRQELQKSMEIYNNVLAKQEARIKELSDGSRKNNSSLLAQISAQKSLINKITEKIGGRNNFDVLRNYVQRIEKITARDLTRRFGPETSAKTKEIMTAVVIKTIDYVSKNPKGAELLVQSGDILAVMLDMYKDEVKNIK